MRIRLYGQIVPLSAMIGLLIIGVNGFAAVFAPIIAPFAEADVVGDAWAEADWTHLLGLDNLGRDVFSRLLYGARLSIGLSLMITTLSFMIGVVGGFTAAIGKGWIDATLSRFVDLILAMPTLIFAFVVLSVMGTDLAVLVVTLACLDSVKVFRLARALAVNVSALEYVEVARLRGEGLWWVITREILPNTTAPLIAEFGLRFSFAFLFVAALSFLGLGVQPPTADWGSMVRDYRDVIALDLPAPFYPAAAIALLTIGVNFVVDWLLALQSRGYGEGA
ncbi:MAG: ABC transporter permease [Acetobacteraceae bacterium]|nr:ABC transporter permease [Acetobacteraceae bacterium]